MIQTDILTFQLLRDIEIEIAGPIGNSAKGKWLFFVKGIQKNGKQYQYKVYITPDSNKYARVEYAKIIELDWDTEEKAIIENMLVRNAVERGIKLGETALYQVEKAISLMIRKETDDRARIEADAAPMVLEIKAAVTQGIGVFLSHTKTNRIAFYYSGREGVYNFTPMSISD